MKAQLFEDSDEARSFLSSTDKRPVNIGTVYSEHAQLIETKGKVISIEDNMFYSGYTPVSIAVVMNSSDGMILTLNDDFFALYNSCEVPSGATPFDYIMLSGKHFLMSNILDFETFRTKYLFKTACYPLGAFTYNDTEHHNAGVCLILSIRLMKEICTQDFLNIFKGKARFCQTPQRLICGNSCLGDAQPGIGRSSIKEFRSRILNTISLDTQVQNMRLSGGDI